MSAKKYVLYPGEVTSKSDGQRHYITARQLVFLYRVSLDECEIWDAQRTLPPSVMKSARERHQTMLQLHPRYDGDYSLPATPPTKTPDKWSTA